MHMLAFEYKFSYGVREWDYLYMNPHHRYTSEIPDLHIAPCNGVASHGPQLGVFRFMPTTHTKQTQSKCVHDLRAPRGFLCVIVFTLRPLYLQVTYTPDKPQSFWLREKPEARHLSPMPRSRWGKFWYLWCISVTHTEKPKNIPTYLVYILQLHTITQTWLMKRCISYIG